jgi:prepilin signal peptidase PulO-like enzyme (type II secretory pathway)
MYILIFFILGTIIGSFLSVLTFRMLNKQEGTWTGRSKCPDCQHPLAVRNLVPLFSYIVQKGKCQYCKKPISKSYPILELVTGAIFAITYFKLQLQAWPFIAGWLVIFTIAIAIAKYDLESFQIPTNLSIPLLIFSIPFSYFVLKTPITHMLIGGLLGFGFFYLQYFISKGKWTGLGDADIAGIIGILFGPFLLFQSLLTSYILGSIVGIYLIVSKQKGAKAQLAFAPYLLLGMFLNVTFNSLLTNLLLMNL